MAQQQTHQFPLDNLAYDLLTIVHQKSKALEAYDRYMRDAQKDPEVLKLLEEIRKEEEKQVERLTPVLSRCLGKSS